MRWRALDAHRSVALSLPSKPRVHAMRRGLLNVKICCGRRTDGWREHGKKGSVFWISSSFPLLHRVVVPCASVAGHWRQRQLHLKQTPHGLVWPRERETRTILFVCCRARGHCGCWDRCSLLSFSDWWASKDETILRPKEDVICD